MTYTIRSAHKTTTLSLNNDGQFTTRNENMGSATAWIDAGEIMLLRNRLADVIGGKFDTGKARAVEAAALYAWDSVRLNARVLTNGKCLMQFMEMQQLMIDAGVISARRAIKPDAVEVTRIER